MPNFRLDRFLTLYFFHPLSRIKGLVSDNKIPILMYHSISDEKEKAAHPYYHINTSPALFAEHMRFLAEKDYSVIDLSDLKNVSSPPVSSAGEAALHNGSLPPGGGGLGRGGRYVVITFDDGYRDFYTNAFPILQKYHFPATVFLPTDFINDNRKTFKGRNCLTWTEVRELHDQGISFGSHTLNHPELYRLPWKMVRKELLDSRLRIEDKLKKPVTSFCYPYAFPQEDKNFVLRLKQELVDQGYRFAVNTVIGRAGRESDPLSLARLPVNQVDDEKLFEAKILGFYDWMAAPQAFVRRMKFHLHRLGPDNR